MLDFGPAWHAKVPVFGLQVCDALLGLVVDVVVGDRVEVPPPEVAGKEAVVVGHPVFLGELFYRLDITNNRIYQHMSIIF